MPRSQKLFLTAVFLFPLFIRADTTYNIAFTDLEKSPTFNNPTGTFTVNSIDQVTSLDVTFTVLTGFNIDGSHPAGSQFVFDASDETFTPTLTFSPITKAFTNNVGVAVIELPPSNLGAYLDIFGTNTFPGDLDLGPYVAPAGFHQPIDDFSYTISGPVSTSAVPEPASAGLVVLSITSLAVLCGRKIWLSRLRSDPRN